MWRRRRKKDRLPRGRKKRPERESGNERSTDEQLEKFVREHSDTKLIIVDTLQKVREAVCDSYSYSSDYEVIQC